MVEHFLFKIMHILGIMLTAYRTIDYMRLKYELPKELTFVCNTGKGWEQCTDDSGTHSDLWLCPASRYNVNTR